MQSAFQYPIGFKPKLSRNVQALSHYAYFQDLDVKSLHGISMLPMMKGEKERIHDMVTSSFPLTHGTPRLDKGVITTEEWSLHVTSKAQDPNAEEAPPSNLSYGERREDYRPGEKKAALFNISSDPGQKNDVISENLDVAKELHKEYIRHLKEWGLSEERLNLNKDLIL